MTRALTPLPDTGPRTSRAWREVGSLAMLLAAAVLLATGAGARPAGARPAGARPVAAQEAAEPGAVQPTIALDRDSVAAGETVTATVSLMNPGPEPLTLDCAAPLRAWLDLGDAAAPGRKRWASTEPWRRAMRRALLEDPASGTGPLALPLTAVDPPPVCPTPTTELDPGATLVRRFAWTLDPETPLPLPTDASVPVVVRAAVQPSTDSADAEDVAPAQAAGAATAAAEGPLTLVTAGIPEVIAPARAVEALFTNETAAAWLDLEPAGTWRRSTLRQDGGRWIVEVRRLGAGCCPERFRAVVEGDTARVRRVQAHTTAWEAARSRTEVVGTLELRLELQRKRAPDGQTTRMRMTVTNLSEDERVWYWSHDNECAAQPRIWIAAGPDASGIRWRGRLARFKRMALRSDVRVAVTGPAGDHVCGEPDPVRLRPGRSVTTETSYRPSVVPLGQRTLQAVGQVDLIGPSRDALRPWDVLASPTVRARFRTGDGSQQVESPSMLIDAALSHPEFADRIRAIPPKRWRDAGVTGRAVWLELEDGERIVGLP